MPIINLSQKEIPTHYYNIIPDLPKPLDPPLHPGTKKPIGPEDLAAIFPMELIKQEMSEERLEESHCRMQKVTTRDSQFLTFLFGGEAFQTCSESFFSFVTL